MMMAKKLILFLLLIFCSLQMAGQIQRKFFNFTLGTTTKQEIINYYKTKKKEIYYSENLGNNSNFSVHYVDFGGHTWPVVHFDFYKNKLYVIEFSDSDGFNPRQTLDLVWKRLDNSLLSKYRQFLNISESSESKKEFEDNRTQLIFDYHYFRGTKFLDLMYIDTRLLKEMLINEDSEL